MKGKRKWILYILVFLLVLSFLLKFGGVAGVVGNAIGVDPETIQYWATMIFYGVLGGILIWVGAPLLAGAFALLGGALVIVGMAMIGITLWEYFGRKKPDDTTIERE